jgi:hypothetical protein
MEPIPAGHPSPGLKFPLNSTANSAVMDLLPMSPPSERE